MDVEIAQELSELRRSGRLTELVSRLTSILHELERHHGEMHVEVAFAIEHLGKAHFENLDYLASATLGERALRIERELFGENSLHCARCLSNLGLNFIRLERYSEAEHALGRAFSICEHLPEGESRWAVYVMSNLALLHYHRKSFDLAVGLWIETLRRIVHEYGFYHRELGSVFLHLARVYHQQGKLLAAERSVSKAIRIQQYWDDIKDPGFSSALRLLGTVRNERGDSAEARTHLTAALEHLRQIRPEGHPMITMLEREIAELPPAPTG